MGDGVGRGGVEGVVVGNVGGETTDAVRRAGGSEELAEELSGGGDVCGPAEPASVASVEVEVDICLVQLLDCVDDTGLVGGGSIRTLLDAWSVLSTFDLPRLEKIVQLTQVGNQVCE